MLEHKARAWPHHLQNIIVHADTHIVVVAAFIVIVLGVGSLLLYEMEVHVGLLVLESWLQPSNSDIRKLWGEGVLDAVWKPDKYFVWNRLL